jgi:signal transduction histidine kinase
MDWFKAARGLIARHPLASDTLVAIALALFVQQDIWGSGDYFSASKAIYVPAALLMTLPLAFRRRAPLAVATVVMGAVVAEAFAVGSAPTPDSQLVGWLLAIYSVAAHCDRVAAAIGGALSLAAGLIWIGFDDFFFPLVVFGGAWFAGRLVRQHQLYAEAVEQRAAALERERDANVRAAAAEERARIARELHDLLSHSVSVMVVQAAAERNALGSDRAAPGQALEAIERTGRQALAEMRRLFTLLRSGAPADLAPQPTLAELDALVEQVRKAGVPVELRVQGEADAVPPGVALCAYRIVQEALTNVIKHAGPARASVVVRYAGDSLELEVADDGKGARTDGSHPGHGLAGMRDRVALYGGEFDAGLRNGGGFLVRARLPLQTTPP